MKPARPVLSDGVAQTLQRASEGGLLLRGRAIAAGVQHGRHRAGSLGQSTEFFDFRAYEPGDPLNRVDWRLYGRTDRFFVRRFHHEAQLGVLVIVDVSASMGFAGFAGFGKGGMSKLRWAQELGAGISFLAAQQGDRVGILAADGSEGGGGTELREGWEGMHLAIARLESLNARAKGEEGSAGDALELIRAGALRAGLVVVISDALDEPEKLGGALAALRSGPNRAELVVVQVLTPDELNLPEGMEAEFVDSETGQRAAATESETGQAYRALLGEHITRVESVVRRAAGRHVLATTDSEAVEVIRRMVKR